MQTASSFGKVHIKQRGPIRSEKFISIMSKTPWRNGYWASPNMPAFLWVVDGEKMDAKNMIALGSAQQSMLLYHLKI